jgi:hypothetical protein
MIFPQWDEVERTLEQELPMFARFLVEWQMPKGLIASEKRFGVLAYHHPELFEESRQQGIGVLYEVMTSFLSDYQKQYPNKPHWEGSATQLHSELNVYSPSIMKDMAPKTLSMQLGTLSKNGFNLTRYKDAESGVTIWKVAYKLRTNVIEERSET